MQSLYFDLSLHLAHISIWSTSLRRTVTRFTGPLNCKFACSTTTQKYLVATARCRESVCRLFQKINDWGRSPDRKTGKCGYLIFLLSVRLREKKICNPSNKQNNCFWVQVVLILTMVLNASFLCPGFCMVEIDIVFFLVHHVIISSWKKSWLWEEPVGLFSMFRLVCSSCHQQSSANG